MSRGSALESRLYIVFQVTNDKLSHCEMPRLIS
jgi:hypothetical protein